MCSLLLLLLTGNVGGAEEEAVYDDEDERILNIGDGELVRAAEYRDARLNDVGERRSNVGEEGGILVAPNDDDDDDWEDDEEDLVEKDSTASDISCPGLDIDGIRSQVIMYS